MHNIISFNLVLLAIFMFTNINIYAQVAINTSGNPPDGKSMLDITSTNTGLLVPRMTQAQRIAIAPAAGNQYGLLVYQTDATAGYWYWNGAIWVRLYSGNGNAWDILGNSGTTPATNFIGTTDAQDLVLRTNNVEKIRILSGGNVGIGTSTPGYLFTISGNGSVFGVDNTATFLAKNSGGGYEAYFWPRWSDNIMYMNYGSSGFHIRNNSSTSTMFMTNGNFVGIGTTSPIYKLHVTGDIYADGGWFRVSGNQGLYFQSYGGGFYMIDATWIRTYGNKSFYHNTGTMRTDGTFQVANAGGRFLVQTNGQTSVNNTAPVAGDLFTTTAVATEPWASNSYNTLADGNCFYALSTDAANTYSTVEVDATTNAGAAVYGHNDASNSSANGIIGTCTTAGSYDAHGVDGLVPNTNNNWGYGGYFQGKWYAVYGVGNLGITGAKSFVIDHPLDPENKTLKHFCIESPEVLNMYRGTVTLDNNGEAIVYLPEYFEAVNINYSYQLTPIGAFAQLYIKNKIANNKFTIAGGNPNMEVSWTIYSERNDLYFQQNPSQRLSELPKKQNEIGKYHVPDLYGKPENLRIGYRNPMQKNQKELHVLDK